MLRSLRPLVHLSDVLVTDAPMVLRWQGGKCLVLKDRFISGDGPGQQMLCSMVDGNRRRKEGGRRRSEPSVAIDLVD